MSFSSLYGLRQQRLRLCFVEIPTSAISVSLKEQSENPKYKNKASLLVHYANSFSAPNFGILFIIIILQYAPRYYQKPICQNPKIFNLLCGPVPLYQNIPVKWKQELILNYEINSIENKKKPKKISNMM